MAQQSSSKKISLQKIRVGKSKIAGKGLFAQGPIKNGETLFCIEGPIIQYAVQSDYRIGQNWLQIRENVWQIPLSGHVWNYINHSCQPNCGMKQGNTVVAMRDIRKNEELTIDYSTIEAGRRWHMHCKCGYVSCRKLIRGIQFLPRELFLKYKPFIPVHLQDIYAQEKTVTTGKGRVKKLFAKNPIKKNEEIFSVKGPIITYASAPDMRIGYRWLAVGKNRWMIPSADNPWFFIRHSCAPNVGIKGVSSVVAMKNIRPGEELTIDDSMTEADIRWQRRCHCGSKQCRGLVKSVQFLTSKLFEKYKPYMSDFVKKQYSK
jgi:SET domain-containing protein